MRVAILLGVVSILGGCDSQPVLGDGESAIVRRTRVVLATATTSEQVTIENISREQQAAEVSARSAAMEARQTGIAPAIAKDSTCAGADLWMFDEANETGRELCFYGVGTANLGSYEDGCAGPICWTWIDVTRSYWPGTEPGFFTSLSLGDAAPSNKESFDGEYRTNAGPVASQSYEVTLCALGGC